MNLSTCTGTGIQEKLITEFTENRVRARTNTYIH